MKGILLAMALILSGCAGLHSMPPNGYSNTNDLQSIRVFFDQFGDLYPTSPEANMPEQRLLGRNYAFSVRTHMNNTNQIYNDATIEKHYLDVAETISDRLEASKKLVFLIHGYNNSYKEASSSFEYIKNRLKSNSKDDFFFVEVYWDGLFKGPFSFPFPLAYWFESMTYSNIAGQVGLRKLINRLPENTELTLITHSRGAGVAFSAISNPVYDDHIVVPPFEKLKGTNISKLNIVSIAPAVGNGHPIGDLSELLPIDSKVFIGFNANDPVLKKSQGKFVIGSERFGDTSLGVNDEFYLAAERKVNQSRVVLQRVVYNGYDAHGIRGYIDNTVSSDCLFWAAKLIVEKPTECSLIQ